MTPLCPVVVGYDFSPGSGAALRRAVTLAARAPFHVLHAVCAIDPASAIPRIPLYGGVDGVYAARIQAALTVEIQRELQDTEVSDRVHFFVHARVSQPGRPADQILELAREVGADLIIIGGDRGDASGRRIGAVADQILREAGCTVELARPKQYPDAASHRGGAAYQGESSTPSVAPHRYTYEDHRANLRPVEWPLY